MKNKGFSLIELLVVITIFGVISLIGYFGFGKISDTSSQTMFNNKIKIIESAALTYAEENKDEIKDGNIRSLSIQDLIAYGYLESDVEGEEKIINPLSKSKDDKYLTGDMAIYYDGKRVIAEYNTSIIAIIAEQTIKERNKVGLRITFDIPEDQAIQEYEAGKKRCEFILNENSDATEYVDINNNQCNIAFDILQVVDIVSEKPIINHTITVKITDELNRVIIKSVRVSLDDSIPVDPPEITALVEGGAVYNYEWTNKNVSIKGDSATAASYEISYDLGETWEAVNKEAWVAFNNNVDTVIYFRSVGATGSKSDIVAIPIKIDKIAPTCITNGGSSAWTSQNVTLTGVCSDTGGSECIGNVTKVYTTSLNSTTESPGSVYDAAGNSKVCPNTTVMIDNVIPQIAVSGNPTSWTKNDVILNISISNSISGLSILKVSGKDVTIVNGVGKYTINENGSYSIEVTSKTGLKSTQNVTVNKIDKTLPIIEFVEIGNRVTPDPTFNQGFYIRPFSDFRKVDRVSMNTPVGNYVIRVTQSTISDRVGQRDISAYSNGIYIHKLLAKIPPSTNLIHYMGILGDGGNVTWLTPQNGTGDWQEYAYLIKAGATGSFGNLGYFGTRSIQPWYIAYSAYYDVTNLSLYNNNVVMQIRDIESGIDGYGINTSSTVAPNFITVPSTTQRKFIDIGNVAFNNNYYLWIKDRAGNVSNTAISIKNDSKYILSKPTIDLRINAINGSLYTSGEWTNENVVQVQSASSINGIQKYIYSHDNVNFADMPTNWNISWQGQWNFYVRAVDNAGNVSPSSDVYTLRIDKTPPSCSLYQSGSYIGFSNLSDDFSGVKAYGMGTSPAHSYNWLGSHHANGGVTVYGYVTDWAGNTYTCAITASPIVTHMNVNSSYYPTNYTDSTNNYFQIINVYPVWWDAGSTSVNVDWRVTINSTVTYIGTRDRVMCLVHSGQAGCATGYITIKDKYGGNWGPSSTHSGTVTFNVAKHHTYRVKVYQSTCDTWTQSCANLEKSLCFLTGDMFWTT